MICRRLVTAYSSIANSWLFHGFFRLAFQMAKFHSDIVIILIHIRQYVVYLESYVL